MTGHLIQREAGGKLRRIFLEHRPLGLAEHLDVAKRKFVIRRTEIEIVDRERFLELGRVLAFGQGDQRYGVVKHVMPADHVGTIGQAVRMFRIRGHQEQSR